MIGRLERRDGVAILWIDNPPVNAISADVERAIIENLQVAQADPNVRAAVIACQGRTFIAGADINVLTNVDSHARLLDPIAPIDRFTKPIVAALHGTALGGGFEVALACDYRLAARSAQVGLPEVKLGILPGGGGTQRLPRLIGVEAALEVLLSGEPISAAKALELGAIDQIVDDDLVAAAVRFARNVAGQPLRRTPGEPLGCASVPADVLARARQRVAREMRNQPAPLRIIDCVEAASTKTLAQGLALEKALFAACLADLQSRALQHVFFAEREARKIPGLARDASVRPIDATAVIGAGTMGGGITMSLLNVGLPVTLLESNADALERGLATIQRNYDISVGRGRLTAEQVAARMKLITPTLAYADLRDADFIIEAVFETLEIKKSVFRQLDAVAKAGAILASNTSKLSIDEIAHATSRPGDVVGTHFFSPANVMRLCEIVRGPATAANTLATALALAKRIGKVGVVSRDCDGFIGNRMVAGYFHQADLLLLEGATPAQVDKALFDFGMAMGRFQMADLAGLDTGFRSRQNYPAGTFDEKALTVDNRLVAMGRYGLKTQAGYYDYLAGDRNPHPSSAVVQLIQDAAREHRIAQRAVSNEEIVERCILALFNIGCEILREGVACRAGDIDIVYVTGYGFPAYRGGPMFWAEQELGLARALEKIRALSRVTGEQWLTPSPLLEQLVAQGKGLRSIEDV